MVENAQYPQYRFDFLKYRPFVVLFTVGLMERLSEPMCIA